MAQYRARDAHVAQMQVKLNSALSRMTYIQFAIQHCISDIVRHLTCIVCECLMYKPHRFVSHSTNLPAHLRLDSFVVAWRAATLFVNIA